MSAPVVLEARNLRIGYKRSGHPPKVVADSLNAELSCGEFACLLGPNGAGKSTLLRTLTGMQPPLSGQVFLDGRKLDELKPLELAKRLSIVLTKPVDAGMLDVQTLVGLGRHPHTNWRGDFGEQDIMAVEKALAEAGLSGFASRRVSELSDGERQRVMLARALAQDPKLLLLDEATAFLDLPGRIELMRLLRDLAHKDKRAVLLCTHDLDLAMRCADRLWLLPKGSAIQSGVPEDLILMGRIGQVFSSPYAKFDKNDGSFRIMRKQGREVFVSGEASSLGKWTRRAMERRGFKLSSQSSAQLKVQVPELSGSPWIVEGHSESYPDLDSLLRALGDPEAGRD